VQNNIDSCSKLYIHITIISLFFSLFISSIRNFILSNYVLENANTKFMIEDELSKMIEAGTTEEVKNYKSKPLRSGEVVKIMEYIAIFAFIIGIISAYIFILKVIL